jgi:hypothetical protein
MLVVKKPISLNQPIRSVTQDTARAILVKVTVTNDAIPGSIPMIVSPDLDSETACLEIERRIPKVAAPDRDVRY